MKKLVWAVLTVVLVQAEAYTTVGSACFSQIVQYQNTQTVALNGEYVLVWPELSAAQSACLNQNSDFNSALSQLCEGDQRLSMPFTIYQQYEREYNTIFAQFQAETNPTRRSNLLTQLRSKETDWAVFGYRNEFRNILYVLDAAHNRCLTP